MISMIKIVWRLIISARKTYLNINEIRLRKLRELLLERKKLAREVDQFAECMLCT